jgi:hypothetical protein
MRSAQVHIASPCHESWDAMSGDEARRFCDVCDKHVHDLSAMRHDDAAALLRERGEGLCVRYTAEADGTLRFRDLVPAASLTRRVLRTVFASALLAACTPHGPDLQGLGEAVLESLREDVRPTPDGGCELTTGPLTTFHLPPGHFLCAPADGAAVAQPPPTIAGGLGPSAPPPAIDPTPPPTMGQAVAAPEPVDPFVPCDPPKAEPPKTEREPVRPRMGKPVLRPVEDRPLRKMGKMKPRDL